MNQPTAPAAAEPQTITVRLDIEVTMSGDLASLAAVTDRAKALIVEATKLGAVTGTAIVGRARLPIV